MDISKKKEKKRFRQIGQMDCAATHLADIGSIYRVMESKINLTFSTAFPYHGPVKNVL
jgi:hypothetical protein